MGSAGWRKIFISTIIFSLFDAGSAWAQAVDYGALEQLFGEPVTTSAIGQPQKVSEVPVNMEIITQDQIRQSGADNIPDVLQFVTGLDFRRSSFNDGEVGIRGYDQPWNPRLLVLVNDRPVYEDFYGDVVWPAFPVQLDEIRQIEVIKGPNSALFGFNAASGVINIVTYDPLLDKVNAVTLRTGTQSLGEGSVVATTHIDNNIGIRLSAGGLTASEFGVHGLPEQYADVLLRPMTGTLNFDSRWQVTPDLLAGLEANVANDNRNFPADGTAEQDRTNTIRAFTTAQSPIGTLDLDVYRTIWDIGYYGGQPEEAVNTVYDVRASDLFKIGTDSVVRLSLEYKNNSATGQFFDQSTIGYNVYSAGAMWNWQILPFLTLTNAMRGDYLALNESGPILPVTGQIPEDFNRISLSAISYNSGLVYAISDYDVVRLTASRGFQLPSLNDFGQQIAYPGFVLVGDPRVFPTAVTNYEIGYDHTFKSLGANLKISVFNQENKNLFGYDAGVPYLYGANTLYQSENIGGSDETGCEIGLKNTPGSALRWNLSYQYASISDAIYHDIAAGVYSAYQDSTPAHVVIAGLGYTLGRWEADSNARWQSSYTDYHLVDGAYAPVGLKNYLVVNARLGYRITKNILAAVTVEQLNQSLIAERANIPVERRAFLSVTFSL